MLNFDYVYYATPNLAVKENLDEETLSDTTIFPTDETLANCEAVSYTHLIINDHCQRKEDKTDDPYQVWTGE